MPKLCDKTGQTQLYINLSIAKIDNHVFEEDCDLGQNLTMRIIHDSENSKSSLIILNGLVRTDFFGLKAISCNTYQGWI